MADQLTLQLAHLYRRAGFGARPEDLTAGVARGYSATVDYLLDRSRNDPGAIPPPALDPRTLQPADTQQARKELRQLRNQQETDLVGWWLERMVLTDQQGAEKLAWFWHDHYATSAQKVDNPHLMLAQNQLFRQQGGAGFDALTQAVAKDGAMMLWLDSNKNNRNRPNENFARELMELFTIGIGNYTDDDVREAARAFAGWRYNRQEGFRVLKGQADPGQKTILGKTAAFTGEEVVGMLVTSPAAARFVTAKLWRHYAFPVGTDHPVVAELAPGFTADLNVTKLVRSILLHPQFVSPEARQSLVKQPVEWMAGIFRQLDMRPSEMVGNVNMATLNKLNQKPFFPPSVGGWPDNGYWISTASALVRYQFALQVSARARLDWIAGANNAARLTAIAARLGVDEWTPSSAETITAAGEPRRQLAAALVTPEYVLN